MTQRRDNPESISNHFDQVFRGIGHRGSSFADVDGIVHDKNGDRLLMMEFKWPDEVLSQAQDMTLAGFAQKPNCTAWVLRIVKPNQYRIRWYPDTERPISKEGLQFTFRSWWDNSDRSGSRPTEIESGGINA